MMTQKKRMLIITLVVLAIISIVLAGIAFAMMKTDLFKTDEQLFYKYFLQNGEIGNLIGYNQIDSVMQKIENNSYKNSGEITFEWDRMQDEGFLNKPKIQFEGKTDLNGGKKSQLISFLNNDKKYFELKFLKTDNRYALKSDEVVTKYVGIENKDLQDFIKKITGTNQGGKINHIAFPNVKALEKLSKEDKKELNTLYKNVLKEYIPKEQYQTKKGVILQLDGQSIVTNQYSVSVTKAQFNNFMICLLETIKQNDTSMELLNKVLDHSVQQDALEELIDEWINDLKKEEDSEEQAISIDVFEKDKNVLLTKINVADTTFSLQNEEKEESYVMILKIEANQDEYQKLEVEKVKNNLEYNIAFHEYSDQKEVSKTVCKLEISKPEEDKIETFFIIGRNDGNQTIKMNYINKKEFDSNLEFEQLDANNSVMLNNYSQEGMQKLFTSILNRLSQLFIERVNSMGVSEGILFNSDVSINNEKNFLEQILNSNIQKNNQFNQQFINSFNNKFEIYNTLELGEKTIKGLLRAIYEHNLSCEDDEKVSLQIDGVDFGYLDLAKNEEATDTLKQNNFAYQMSFIYNEETKLIKSVQLNR